MSVVDSRNVGSASCYDGSYVYELSRLVLKRDLQSGIAAARYQTSGNYSRQNVYIYVSSRHKANHLFAFYRDLAEHHCCNRYGTCALCNELLLFDQRQYGCCDLVFCDGYHIVNILLYERESQIARMLYCDAVCKSAYRVQRYLLVVLQAVRHACRFFCLYAVYLYIRFKLLYSVCNARDKSAAADRHYYHIHIRQLIKDLGMKVSQLESLQKTGIETKDTVFLEKKDSTENSPLVYHDAWTDIEYLNRKLTYSMRDSLAIALEREYKHRFLFIKWGTKGYDVKVANFNPHSSIRYNTFVKKGRK